MPETQQRGNVCNFVVMTVRTEIVQENVVRNPCKTRLTGELRSQVGVNCTPT